MLPSPLPSLRSVYDIPNMKLEIQPYQFLCIESPSVLSRNINSSHVWLRKVNCGFSSATAFVQLWNKWASLSPHLQKDLTYSTAWLLSPFLGKVWSQYNSIGFLLRIRSDYLGEQSRPWHCCPWKPCLMTRNLGKLSSLVCGASPALLSNIFENLRTQAGCLNFSINLSCCTSSVLSLPNFTGNGGPGAY